MIETLFASTQKTGLRYLMDLFLLRGLSRRSKEHLRARPQRMAVFANDYIGNRVVVFGLYEREELETIFEFLKPLADEFKAGLALDIGANIGNHTLFLAEKFRRVCAFEPNPDAFALLSFNVRAMANVSVHEFGLGDESGDFELIEHGGNIGGSSIAQATEGRRSLRVIVQRLDAIELATDQLCFIKIDVEGFEKRVLDGAWTVISKCQPVILLEQLKREFVQGTTASVELLRMQGYRFCWYQGESTNKGVLARRAHALRATIFGRIHRVVTASAIPERDHPMLIAVPPRFATLLGLPNR